MEGIKNRGKIVAKQLDMSVQYWTILDKENSLNRLLEPTEGVLWWRWGRVELLGTPVQVFLVPL